MEKKLLLDYRLGCTLEGRGKRKHLKTQKIKKRRNKTAFSYKVVFVYVLQKLQGNNDF